MLWEKLTQQKQEQLTHSEPVRGNVILETGCPAPVSKALPSSNIAWPRGPVDLKEIIA